MGLTIEHTYFALPYVRLRQRETYLLLIDCNGRSSVALRPLAPQLSGVAFTAVPSNA